MRNNWRDLFGICEETHGRSREVCGVRGVEGVEIIELEKGRFEGRSGTGFYGRLC